MPTASFSNPLLYDKEEEDAVYLSTVESAYEKKKHKTHKFRLAAASVVLFFLFLAFTYLVYNYINSSTVTITVLSLRGPNAAKRYGVDEELFEALISKSPRIATYDLLNGPIAENNKSTHTLRMAGRLVFFHVGNISIESLTYSIISHQRIRVGGGSYTAAQSLNDSSILTSMDVDSVGKNVRATALKIDVDATLFHGLTEYETCTGWYGQLFGRTIELNFVVSVKARSGRTNIFGNEMMGSLEYTDHQRVHCGCNKPSGIDSSYYRYRCY